MSGLKISNLTNVIMLDLALSISGNHFVLPPIFLWLTWSCDRIMQSAWKLSLRRLFANQHRDHACFDLDNSLVN